MRTLQSFTSLDDVARRYGDEPRNAVGILSDHVGALAHLARPHHIGEGEWMVPHGGGRAYPVVCSEIIAIYTEDGPCTGRCGLRSLADTGTCPRHCR